MARPAWDLLSEQTGFDEDTGERWWVTVPLAAGEWTVSVVPCDSDFETTIEGTTMVVVGAANEIVVP